ncbi:MAG TPA: hypothetical protein VNH18_08970 [Bryobacteraceae bacterium]|nr:hypothetical protein [Bryobacteraceae bacterium]
MDLPNIIGQLRDHLAGVNATIAAMQRMETGGQKRRGRPPKGMARPAAVTTTKPSKPATKKRKPGKAKGE